MTRSSVKVCRAHWHQASRLSTTCAAVCSEPWRELDCWTARTSTGWWKTALTKEGEEMVADDAKKGSIPIRLVNQVKIEDQKYIEYMWVFEVFDEMEPSGSKVIMTRWMVTHKRTPEKQKCSGSMGCTGCSNKWMAPTVSITLQLLGWNWWVAYSVTLRRMEGTGITSWQSRWRQARVLFTQSLSRKKCCGRLRLRLFETRHAARSWQREIEKGSKAAGMVMGKMSKCSFTSPCGKLEGVVHGDDILLAGPRSLVDAVRMSLRKLQKTREQMMGARPIDWTEEGLRISRDPRHVKEIIEGPGLESQICRHTNDCESVGQNSQCFPCPELAGCDTPPEVRDQVDLLGNGSLHCIDHGESRLDPKRCEYVQSQESGVSISAWASDHLDVSCTTVIVHKCPALGEHSHSTFHSHCNRLITGLRIKIKSYTCLYSVDLGWSFNAGPSCRFLILQSELCNANRCDSTVGSGACRERNHNGVFGNRVWCWEDSNETAYGSRSSTERHSTNEKILLSTMEASMEGLIPCLVLSSPPMLILLSRVPEHTPTTPLKWLPWLKHYLFLVHMVQWPEMSNRVSIMILNTLLEFVWARSKPAHMCSWHSHVDNLWSAPNTGHGSPCNTCTVTVEIWVMNVLTMPLHLGHSDLPLATMLPHDGFIITLTLPCVSMAVTTSARFWNECSTLELMQRRYLKIEVSVVFTIGIIVFLVHFYVIYDPALSLLFKHVYFVLQNK